MIVCEAGLVATEGSSSSAVVAGLKRDLQRLLKDKASIAETFRSQVRQQKEEWLARRREGGGG